MTGSWAEIDWDAPRPDESAVREALQRLRYDTVELPRTGMDPMMAALRQVNSRGGAVLARFRAVQDDEVLGWFAARNRFDEIGFFAHFLGSGAVREALPELRAGVPLGPDLGFEESWAGTLSLDGELAAILVHGGAYETFAGSAAEAKRLGVAFVDAIVGERHDRFHVYRSHEAWCPWFAGVVWDWTDVLIDHDRRELVLLCITDSDEPQ